MRRLAVSPLLKYWVTFYLFNKVNAGLQVHAEVDELPLDPFFLVFLLLQDEHVMVEELLQSLIGIVDTQLLKAVELKPKRSFIIRPNYE